MNRHWVEFLYESFMLRDLIGYVAPGSILITGLLCELGKVAFLKSLFLSWSGIAVLVGASYIAATGLRLLGTSLRIVLFHRRRGIFGRGWLANAYIINPQPWQWPEGWKWISPWKWPTKPWQYHKAKNLLFYIERGLWRRNEEWLSERYQSYARMDKSEFDAVLKRESAFMHLTGLAGIASLTLAAAVWILPQNGFLLILGFPHNAQDKENSIVITMLLISIVFILGHYRHTHQTEMLKVASGGNHEA